MPADGYVWLILAYGEADQLAGEIQRLTGLRVYEDHVDDVKNLAHPSSFDSTEDYELVIFRGLRSGREERAHGDAAGVPVQLRAHAR